MLSVASQHLDACTLDHMVCCSLKDRMTEVVTDILSSCMHNLLV